MELNKASIKQAIEKKVASNYSVWQVGITNNSATRKQQHEDDGKSVKSWTQWEADSLSDARDIESHFLGKGMKGGGGGDLDANKTVYVYIF